jgi:hypothetical protein
MTTPPDFDDLGRKTPWNAGYWRVAWETLINKDLWPTLMELTAAANSWMGITSPLSAARALNNAMAPEWKL